MSADQRTPSIDMDTAHDVRRLVLCARCGFAGDRQYMPEVRGMPMHGYCAFDELGGVDGLLGLPSYEYGKVTLAEIGPSAMKELCDKASHLPRTSPRVAADSAYRRKNR